MAYNEIEKRFLGVMAERDFPTLPSETAIEPKATSQAEMKPTPKSPVLGGVADFVYKVRDLANQYEIKDWVPLIGNMGVGDLLVGKAPEEIEEWAYGNSPVRINPYAGQTASFVPEIKPRRQEQLADALMLGADVLPVAGAAKGAKKIIKATENLPVGASIKPISSAPVTDLGFYSAVEDAALNVQRKSGAGQAFLNDIAKGSNVTKDEIKWIGLDDFLKGKKNVTRDEVQQFIAQNKVDVQEVTLGTNPTRWEGNALIVDNNPVGEIRDTSSGYAWRTPDGQYQLLGANRMFDAVEKVQQKLGVDVPEPSNPKFGKWTLPGGENYREILLTLPAKERLVETQIPAAKQKPTVFAASNGKFELLDEMGETFATYNTKAEAEQAATDWAAPFTKKETVKDKEYQSSHWDEPNVLAHIRVNDRVDADGKKMLLVEEVQSDWHQAGRDKGYQQKTRSVPQIQKDLDSVIAELRAKPGVSYAPTEDDWARHPEITSRYDALQSEWDAARQAQKTGGVPDAPMKDTWYQLALKRVLKYAADNGYERIGLTTGARQAERYDLSKQVDGIFYTKNDDGTFNVSVAKGDSEVWADTAAKPERLSEVVGKDIAKKIVDGEGSSEDGVKALRGLDLQVGGEGMKKYYDEVYPKFLEKYGKKWGAKVGETRINAADAGDDMFEVVLPNGKIIASRPNRQQAEATASSFDGAVVRAIEHGEPVRFVDITPEMRESVKKGQPMFVAAPVATGAGSATMQGQEEQ